MNLWAKRNGQLLLLAVLFLISCEDDKYFLGFPNEAKKSNVKFQEFSIGNGAIISIDSISTDNNSTFRRFLIGEDVDPVVGTSRAETFAQFFSDGVSIEVEAGHTYIPDSVVLTLQLDNYSHGLTGDAIGKFNVYKVLEDLSYSRSETYTMPGTGKDVLVKIPTFYYPNSTASYDLNSLGQTRFQELFYFDGEEKRVNTTINPTKLSSTSDTLIVGARLNDSFRDELFNLALTNTDQSFTDANKFKDLFKGIAIIPEESNAILGFNPQSKFSRIKLYFHSEVSGEVADTLSEEFYFNGVSFHSINSIRNSGFPSPDVPFVGVDEGNQRIVQNGEVMITKIDLNNFYAEFTDIIDDDNIIINAAEIVIESVTSSDEYTPLPVLELRLMNDENDSYLNYKMINQTKRDSLSKFYVFNDGKNYYVNSDNFQSQSPLVAGLGYNSTKKSYTGSVTFLIQNLFSNRFSDYRFRYLALYPGSTRTGSNSALPIGKTLNRSLFLKENIKLRVYYTQANKSNL